MTEPLTLSHTFGLPLFFGTYFQFTRLFSWQSPLIPCKAGEWASQVVLKNLMANAGDKGDVRFDSMDRGTWWGTVHGVLKELDMT